MSINDIIPEDNDILKDDNQLWYFTKNQKSKIIAYLETCSLEDLKDSYPMSNVYFVPTWYYFLNDYDVAKKLIEKPEFKHLLGLSEQDYNMPKNKGANDSGMFGAFKKIVTHLDTTLSFTQNNEVLLALKKAGFVFKNNSFANENYYRTYEIIKAGVIDFNEEYLIENIYSVGTTYNSILQKILFAYENTKDSKQDLLHMAKSIKGFVELGCKTEIEYKKLISASEYFISETKNYKDIIKQYCPELNDLMEKLDFIEKMQSLSTKKQARGKI